MGWFNDHVHGDTCIVSSSKKKINKIAKNNDGHTQEGISDSKRKKVGACFATL